MSEALWWAMRDAALRAERDEAIATAERATALAERYGEAIVAISEALPNVNKARLIIVSLDSDPSGGSPS